MKITTQKNPYKFAIQFTDVPGGRSTSTSSYSGEEFRKKIERYFEEHPNEIFWIDMADVYTLGASFLDEAFAKLAKQKGKEWYDKHIVIDFKDDNWAKAKTEELIAKRLSED